jgi:hypothetical protein
VYTNFSAGVVPWANAGIRAPTSKAEDGQRLRDYVMVNTAVHYRAIVQEERVVVEIVDPVVMEVDVRAV